MISANEAVVWVNRRTKQVMVQTLGWGYGRHMSISWSDPIGAAYSQWQEMDNKRRMQLMVETVIELGMRDFVLKDVLKAFAEVEEFRALGGESFPMCRALTSALVGRCLEPNTMGFEELLEHYGKENVEA